MAKKTETQAANLDRFRPKKDKDAKRSEYFPKDEIFTKTKTFIDRGKVENLEADWRRVGVGGKIVELVKGEAVLQSEIGYFNEAARAHYLVKKGKTVNKAAEEAKAKAAEEAKAKAAEEAKAKAAEEAKAKAAEEAKVIDPAS